MSAFFNGGLTLAALIAGLFFFHYHRLSQDRFFLLFGIAFVLLGVQWLLSGMFEIDDHARPFVYLVRLVAFLVILAAIVDKNRGQGDG